MDEGNAYLDKMAFEAIEKMERHRATIFLEEALAYAIDVFGLEEGTAMARRMADQAEEYV